MPKAIFNWSGGKDSAICLHQILQAKEYDVLGLLTSVNKEYQRIAMHGVRVELLQAQVDAIGLPLHQLVMPEMPTMKTYNDLMQQSLDSLKSQGITHSIFGDIFLEDLRKYREDQLKKVDVKAVFPLWKRSTQELVESFVADGFKAVTVCVNDKYLDESFVGREMDKSFFDSLPDNVDPCGENGEFHSYVYDGPIFKESVKIKKGEVVHKSYQPCQKKEEDDSYKGHDNTVDNGFWYCDLLKG